MIDHPSRREFIKKAAVIGGGLLILNAPFGVGKWIREAPAAEQPKGLPRLTALALELDGVVVGSINSAEGGLAALEVSTGATTGADKFQTAALGKVRYEPITVNFRASGMQKSVYQWITDNQQAKATARKNGAILAFGPDGKVFSRHIFLNAFITEAALSTLSAESLDPIMMTLKIVPETTTWGAAGGATSASALSQGLQKGVNAGNFRLSIAGLEQTASATARIDPVVFKCPALDTTTGLDVRVPTQRPAACEPPKLVITVPESAAGQLYAWHDEVVLKGKNVRRNGELSLGGPKQEDVFLNMSFFDLLPVRLTRSLSPNGIFLRAELLSQRVEIK